MENAKKAMLKAKKLLKALIFAEIVETLCMAALYLSRSMQAAAGAEAAQSAMEIAMFSAVVAVLVTIVLNVFLIRKGSEEIEVPDNSSSHVVIAWILLVSSAVSVVTGAMAVFGGAADAIENLLQIVVSGFAVVVMFKYVLAVRALRASAKA